ncbi:TolC family protein [Dickeya fangzhongdai]|uniref:TolC family protein n=1 Tax=Dickeya fangzhongdai TaxID=1778540 RepID=UPI00092CE6C2|nr:TolC family protein [Dickeya fangzhongdai]
MTLILRLYLGVVVSVMLCVAHQPQAIAADIFGTDAEIPPTAATPLGKNPSCQFGPVKQPLLLTDAVERSLCNNPKTGEAWAQIKAQAAALGTAKGAYLPTLSLSGQHIKEDSKTVVPGHSEFNSNNSSPNYSSSVSLSWVLYDFGGRSAALDKARALLVAAQTNHLQALQTIFITTAKDYYNAQAAAGELAAALETERIARKSLDVVISKEAHGAASMGDELQARTAYLQARANRTKSEGNWQSDIGILAGDLALRPDTPISLPAVDDGVKPDSDFQKSVSALINEATRIHPGILAAQAQLKAAEADVNQTKAEGMPSLSLIVKSSHDNQRVNEGLGQPYFKARHTDNYVGVQVSVPLFEGFTREYKVRKGIAHVEEKQHSLDDMRNNVELDVWKSYQSLKVATSNLPVTHDLLLTAQRSYDAAEHRYENGVGSILELLNTQTALSNAEKQHIQSLTDWRYSRLELAEKLGYLGLESVGEK